MNSFVIKIAIDVDRAEIFVNKIPKLGITIDSVDEDTMKSI